MARADLIRLAALVRAESESLLRRWREQVKTLPSAANLDTPTLNDHVPGLIQELATALYSGSEETIAKALVEGTPPAHGVQRFQDGFDIEEVVAEYNILRACVHDLGDSHGIELQGEPFHVLNRVLDGAIGVAVQAFATQQASAVQIRREEYLAFVVHDLRTPLNAIALAMNFLERAASDTGGAASGDGVLWKILRRNVQQLEELVGRIIKENVNIEAEAGFKLEQRLVDLWPLVEQVRLDVHPMAQAAQTRLVNTVPEELLVYADAGMVRRILQNLAKNAIAYAPGGEVLIAARTTGDGSVVECTVTDDGQGIPAHRIGSVFEKMETDPVNTEGSGMGLGLAIVKAFVEAHGGQVGVTSELGDGACFRFTLPASAPRK